MLSTGLLLLFLTAFPQTVTVGVVVQDFALSGGGRLEIGDRVLVIDQPVPDDHFFRGLRHPGRDSARAGRPCTILAPDARILTLPCSMLVIGGAFQPPDLHCDTADTTRLTLYDRPDRTSSKLEWHPDRPAPCFCSAAFDLSTGELWGQLDSRRLPGGKPIPRSWLPFDIRVAVSSLTQSNPRRDSVLARTLFRWGDHAGERYATRNRLGPGNTTPGAAASCYRLSYEAAEEAGFSEQAASALLMLALNNPDSVTVNRLYFRARTRYPDATSLFGRVDCYIAYKLMQAAWQHRDTTRACSLAVRIVEDFPGEDGQERFLGYSGWGGYFVWSSRSLWFDVEAAQILIDASRNSLARLEFFARFLILAKDPAVRFLGYRNLVVGARARGDRKLATATALIALALPNCGRFEKFGDIDDLVRKDGNRNFKQAFLDELETLLTFSERVWVYNAACGSSDTIAVKEGVKWLSERIGCGELVPRPGLVARRPAPAEPRGYAKTLLGSLVHGPKSVLTAPCTIYTRDARQRGDAPKYTRKSVLRAGHRLRSLFLSAEELRVTEDGGAFGWVHIRDLSCRPALTELPAIACARPLFLFDLTGDGVKDLVTQDYRFRDGRSLLLDTLPIAQSAGRRGFLPGRQVATSWLDSTVWLLGLDRPTRDSFPLPRIEWTSRILAPGVFVLMRTEGTGNPDVWLTGVDSAGPGWVRLFRDEPGTYLLLRQSDTVAILSRAKHTYLISTRDGHTIWERKFDQPQRGNDRFFLLDGGFVGIENDSVAFRDYAGRLIWQVSNASYGGIPQPPSAMAWSPSAGEDWPTSTRVDSRYFPVFSSRQGAVIILISARDGSEHKSLPYRGRPQDVVFDRHGIYLPDSVGFRAWTWDGDSIAVPRIPYLSFPVWDGHRIAFYWSQPMGLLLSADAAREIELMLDHRQ